MSPRLPILAWMLSGLCLGFGASALAEGNAPPGQSCYQKCIQPMQDCQKKCGKQGRCLAACAKELGDCTDKCGGPPKPPPTENP